MQTISVLKPTVEVLNKVKAFFEQHGYKNILVNYNSFTLSAEKFKLFSGKKYVDVNITSPRPVISVIEMNVHSRTDQNEAEEEQWLHDKINTIF